MNSRRLICSSLVLLAILVVPQSAVTASSPTSPSETCTGPYPNDQSTDQQSPQNDSAITGVATFDAGNQTVTITFHNVMNTSTPLFLSFSSGQFSPDLAIRNTRGFRNRSTNTPSEYRYMWDGFERQPSITFTITNTVPTTAGNRYYAMRDSWAVVPLPITLPTTVNYTVAGSGIAADRMAYFGAYDTHTRSNGCEEFRAIVPAAANLTAPPDRLLTDLQNASTTLDVGERYRTNYVIILPSPATDAASVGNVMVLTDRA